MRNRFNVDYENWKILVVLKLKIEFKELSSIVEDYLKLNFTQEIPYLDKELYKKS